MLQLSAATPLTGLSFETTDYHSGQTGRVINRPLLRSFLCLCWLVGLDVERGLKKNVLFSE